MSNTTPPGSAESTGRDSAGADPETRSTWPRNPESASPPDSGPPDAATAAAPTKRRPSRRKRSKASDATEDPPERGESPAKPRRRRKSRSKPKSADEAPENTGASDESGSEDSGTAERGTPAGRGRRTSSGRRRRRGGSRGAADDSEAQAAESAEARDAAEPDSRRSKDDGPDAPDEDETGARRRRPRRRGSRGGRRRSAAREAVAIDDIPGEEDLPPLEAAPELPAEEEKPARRRRKARGAASAEAVEPASRAKSRRKTKKKAASAADTEEIDESPVRRAADARPNVILVNASDPDETRVAVVEDGQITDFQMTVKNQLSLVNDIYRGKVVNLEPAIGAAFIDFGQGRNGFLHTSDVLSCYGDDDWDLSKLLSARVDVDEWDADSSQPEIGIEIDEADLDAPNGDSEASDDGKSKGKGKKAEAGKAEKGGRRKGSRQRSARHRARPRLPIPDLLSKGGSVVVQITKDAIGDKGPTLTTYISIPGRHLVLMPSVARTGVSRKIDDEKERRRLKRILKGMKVPDGMGVIVRTAGIGATKAELKRDLEYLLMIWETFGKRLTLGRGPIALYEESDVAIRTMRDLFTPATEKVVVDDRRVFDRMVEFTQKLMPEEVGRIELHEGARPLFNTYGVEQDFERIFARRVDLASGGSIVFDQTEALVAIDVNSGKTRSDGFDFEDVALKTNLEAVPEIARQIRLRDLGGIVVVDFIDMMRMANRRAVERAFRSALSGDRARSKIGRISQFGLLEMTRQRLGAGMSKMLFTNCPRCRGTGRIRTADSRAVAILRRLGSALTLKGFTKVEVRAHPEVVELLNRNYSRELDDLQRRYERSLSLTPVPDQVEDSVLRYLRADGREVRPGGRRKR